MQEQHFARPLISALEPFWPEKVRQVTHAHPSAHVPVLAVDDGDASCKMPWALGVPNRTARLLADRTIAGIVAVSRRSFNSYISDRCG